LVQRLATGGELDAPWGIALATHGFGPFSDKLLIGNFGDGRILAYATTGQFLGELDAANGRPVVIDCFWALRFGNGGAGGDVDDLYFTAGPDDETHGVFGEIELAR